MGVRDTLGRVLLRCGRVAEAWLVAGRSAVVRARAPALIDRAVTLRSQRGGDVGSWSTLWRCLARVGLLESSLAALLWTARKERTAALWLDLAALLRVAAERQVPGAGLRAMAVETALRSGYWLVDARGARLCVLKADGTVALGADEMAGRLAGLVCAARAPPSGLLVSGAGAWRCAVEIAAMCPGLPVRGSGADADWPNLAALHSSATAPAAGWTELDEPRAWVAQRGLGEAVRKLAGVLRGRAPGSVDAAAVLPEGPGAGGPAPLDGTPHDEEKSLPIVGAEMLADVFVHVAVQSYRCGVCERGARLSQRL
jgi:hypothetical protein